MIVFTILEKLKYLYDDPVLKHFESLPPNTDNRTASIEIFVPKSLLILFVKCCAIFLHKR
jgi:hypothetical protein